MGSYAYDHDSSWATTSINGSTVGNGSSETTSSPISNDGKIGTQVSVTVVYGSPATAGVQMMILRDIDGTNFESPNDLPWGLSLPYTASGTHRRAVTVPPDIGDFKVAVVNPSGASVTATVRTRQIVGLTT